MRGQGSGRVQGVLFGLSIFLVHTYALSCAMAKGKAQRRKKHIQRALSIKSVALVNADSLQKR